MQKSNFTVYLSACAYASTGVEVEAETPDEARKLALETAQKGLVDWDDEGVDLGTVEVSEVQDENKNRV